MTFLEPEIHGDVARVRIYIEEEDRLGKTLRIDVEDPDDIQMPNRLIEGVGLSLKEKGPDRFKGKITKTGIKEIESE